MQASTSAAKPFAAPLTSRPVSLTVNDSTTAPRAVRSLSVPSGRDDPRVLDPRRAPDPQPLAEFVVRAAGLASATTAAEFRRDPFDDRRRLRFLVAAVHDADNEFDFAEDAYLRALTEALDLPASALDGLTIDVEVLRDSLTKIRRGPPPPPGKKAGARSTSTWSSSPAPIAIPIPSYGPAARATPS